MLGRAVQGVGNDRKRVKRVLSRRSRVGQERRDHLAQIGWRCGAAGGIRRRTVRIRRGRVHMMMVMSMSATNRLGQVLYIRQRVVLRSRTKVAGQLIQLVGLRRIAIGTGGTGSALQIRSNLRSDLLILGRVRLLQLLQRAHYLSERRQRRAAVLRERN